MNKLKINPNVRRSVMEPNQADKSKAKVAELRPSKQKQRRFRVVKLEERVAPSTAPKAARELTGVTDAGPDGTIVFGSC
jgi:hypothetical protein